MALIPGTRLGPYEVTALIGVGGMGEVYRARDTKLDRDVAIKVLPASFATDAERLARFTREAKTLASLNHPNIAAIYGLEEGEGMTALVMELVEGDDLSQRIARGAISVDEALPIAKQIAAALEAAHEQNIVHRDLKPANIKVRADGTVKVLDFGLAKAMEPTGAMSPGLSQSPTITTPAMTQAGMILGTAAYMSPEQAEGLHVDKRADIWSFGVVLWEMLTGTRLFEGQTVSRTLADVLRMEIEFSQLPNATPASIRALLRRCLDREVNHRLRDIGEARVAVQDYLANPKSATEVPSTQNPPFAARGNAKWGGWAVSAVLALGMAAAGTLALFHLRAEPQPQVVKLEVPPPEEGILDLGNGPLAASPDGRRIVFRASVDGKSMLWVRDLDSLDARMLPGTENPGYPFWAPNSRQVAFSSAGKLMKIDVTGGPAQTIANATAFFRGGTWNQEGVIVFAAGATEGLSRVSAAGGPPTPITELDKSRNEDSHRHPHFLPDGHHFFYLARSSDAEKAAVFVGDLESPNKNADRKLVVQADNNAQYVEPGYILFARDRSLMAQPFDAGTLETTGDAVPIAEQVGGNPANNYAYFGASRNGVLAYSSGGVATASQLTWFDRTGRSLGTLGPPTPYREFRLSPDGKRAAFSRIDPQTGAQDLWLAELASGIFSRLTSDPAPEDDPVWSPDGRQVAFHARRKGSQPDIYLKTLGGGEETVLFEAEGPQYTDDWTKDGRFIIFRDIQSSTGSAEYALPMFGENRRPVLLLKDSFIKDQFNVSPDGRWIAYNSDESQRTQVYAAAFPSMTDRRQVSNDGGGIPKWRRDGKELYYLSTDGKLMSVDVRSTETTIDTGAPKVLFQTPITVRLGLDQYDVTADGQKFLLLQPAERTTLPPITVVVNWLASVTKR